MSDVVYRTVRYKLGKKPASHSVSFLWDMFFDTKKLPPTPIGKFGHSGLIPSGAYGMLGNDQVGDCVLAGAAHEDMIFNAMGGKKVKYITSNVLSDYSALTGYVPGRDDTDVGADMGAAAAYRRKIGILAADGTRQTIDGYVAIRAGKLDQVLTAVNLFGACGVGVQLPSSAMDQFDEGIPWKVVSGNTIVGGHYLACVGRNSAGNILFVTWGRIHAAEPAWVKERMDEGIAYLDLSVLNQVSKISPEGADEAKLRTYLANL